MSPKQLPEKMNQEERERLVPRFLILTFAFSWGFWALAILLKQLLPDLPLHGLPFIIGSFGPLFGVCRVLKLSWKDLPRFIFSGRKRTWLYILIFSGALTLIFVLSSVKGLLDTNIINNLIQTPLMILFTALVAGGNEEPAWRGFLQPTLEKKYGFPLATLIVGVVWTLWHGPLWFYNRGGNSFLLYFFIVLFFCIWFAGLYKKTQSIFSCVFVHAFMNAAVGRFHGFGEAEAYGDLAGLRPLVFFAGVGLLTAYSIYLWYQTDRQEKAQAKLSSTF